MVPPIALTEGAPELTRKGDQLTYVFFKDGIEDIALRPAFEGKLTDFGMLIPFPSPPEIRKVSDDIFVHLHNVAEPPVIEINLRPRRGGGGFIDIGDSLMFFEMGAKVRVIREEAVGMYQVAVLEAANPKALAEWMTAHGYIYPTGMDKACEDYIKDGWCFVAVKANIGSKAKADPQPGMRKVEPEVKDAAFEGAVQAMGFRFRVKEPVIPMRLSAFNAGRLFNRVYILTDHPCRINELPDSLVKLQLPGAKVYSHLTDPLEIKVIGGTFIDAARMGYMDDLDEERDPKPRNGKAGKLFASDLSSIAHQQLSRPHEDHQKELLRINERFNLRAPVIDKMIEELIETLYTGAYAMTEDAFEGLTLTVIEGDFPRETIAAKNLTLGKYQVEDAPSPEK